ncbi:C1QL [Mytilus coruscus]|uniref:C1QL n=1 Tax=Mytilus coruscus TaxID=42192 RepID=A0A6J8BZU1_MYTCO|nr:C1QL [Mytilus coruscus]
MESRMLMLFVFFLFSYSVLACDTGEEIRKIHEILKQQQSQILKLQNENKVLRKNVDISNKINSTVEQTNLTPEDSEGKAVLQKRVEYPKQSTHNKALQDKGAVPASEPQIVAFSAYMSTSEHNPSSHHQLVFDVVQTNIGNAYNKYTGAFVAPVSGVYVFAWTIYTGDNGKTFFNIIVNNSVYGSTFGETDNGCCDYDSDSGTIVVSLNQGDTVYIRSSRQASTEVPSNDSFGGKTTFAGWKLN